MAMPRGRLEDSEFAIMSLTQEQIRKVMDVTRLLALMIDDFAGDRDEREISEKYQEILKIEEECKMIKRSIEEQVMRVGQLLPEREDYIRLANGIDRISDKAEAAAYRLINLNKIGASGREICPTMCDLSDGVLTVVERLKEAILAVRLDSTVLHQKLAEVERQERVVDEIYRKVDLMLLQSQLSVSHLLLSREIVGLLEDMADKAEEVVNILRALFAVVV